MAWTVPQSFFHNSPKLRVLIIAKWHKRKTAQKRDEPQKMTHSSETEFFWGGSNGKVVALGVLVKCPVDDYHDSKTKNCLLPQISKFWGPNCTFSSLMANWSSTGQYFHHEKGASSVPSLIWGFQKFYSIPPKKWSFGPKTAKFTDIFGLTSAFLAQLVSWPPKKWCEQGV